MGVALGVGKVGVSPQVMYCTLCLSNALVWCVGVVGSE